MILGDAEITRILSEINSQSEVDRRASAHMNNKIYDDELYSYVLEKLQTWFPKTWESYNVADYNIHKKIVDKKAKSYVRAPIRTLTESKENEAYSALLNDFNFNDTMKIMDRYKNQYKYCGLGIIREKVKMSDGTLNDKFNFWALAPYEFNVHRDGNDNIYAWSIPTGMQGDAFVWTLWTNESHVKVKTKVYKSFQIIHIEGNELNVNPYGIIPFIYVPVDVSGKYPAPSTLPRQAIELNTNLPIYLTSGNMQIGQLVLKHPANAKIETVTTGLMNAMVLPQSDKPGAAKTEADYISPNPNLAGHKDSIVTWMLMILDEHGINGSSVTKGGETFTLGFDRYISMADVTDLIDDNQEIYTRVENVVFQIIKNMFIKDGNFIFKSEKLKVKFSPKILSSDGEKLDNLAKKKALGIWEEWQLLQDADPNLTDDEAKAIIAERMAKNPDAKNVFNGAQVTSLVAVVTAVAQNQIPRESGVQILMASFGLAQEQAERIIPTGFTPAALPGVQTASSSIDEILAVDSEDESESEEA